MTEKEEYLLKCAEDLNQYCSEHENDCQGCVLYQQIRVGTKTMASCKISGSPVLWDLEEDKEI